MAKRTFTQRSFALGEIIDDFLEGDDLEARQNSLRGASNVRITGARTAKARPGTYQRKILTDADDVIEIRPSTNLVFGLVVNDTSLVIIDPTAATVHTIASVPWTDSTTVWIEPFRERTVIGGPFGLYVLTYDGSWSLAEMSFATSSGAGKAQPYWAFRKDIQIQPSATTGSITVTASAAIWSASYVGTRIRYGQREISITGYTSPTVVSGTVVSPLPPSFSITVASAAVFRIGDIVVGQTTNFSGLVTNIVGNVLSVITIEFFDGPDISEKLSGPSGSTTVSAKAVISPLASPIWDEALMSPVRGYPRAGSSAAGRLALTDFPAVPDLVVLSSVRDITDFEAGSDDDDGIVRQVGDNAPRFLHAVNAGDLLLFSDRGVYYVALRDNGILSPRSFNAILIDKRPANHVKPVVVDDNVVFVEGSGKTISAARLDGNIYLKWSITQISNFHSHLIQSPKKLCAPPIYSNTPDKYLFVVNEGGTVAVVSWIADFGTESIGFVPWNTEGGSFVNVSPIFGGYWAIVDRTIGSTVVRFLEEFSDAAVMDSTVDYTTSPIPALAGATLHVWKAGYYSGTTTVNGSGVILDNGSVSTGSELGFNFVSRLKPWPVEDIQTQRSGMLKARLIRVAVSVKDTKTFQFSTGVDTRTIESYRVGNNFALPGPDKTDVFRFPVLGFRTHHEVEIIKHQPGPFHVLAITQEVQV